MKRKLYRLKYFLHNIEKYVWINVIAVIISLLCVSSISLGYSILTKDLAIKSDIILAADNSIRIIGVDNFNSFNEGYEIYSPNINKLDLSLNVGLPNIDSTVTYNVTIRNGTDKLMQLKYINNKESTNSNIQYVIKGLSVKDVIKKLSSLTFTITYKYKGELNSLPNETIINDLIQFEFMEYTKSYNDYVQDGILLNLKGTNVPINNKWVDTENNKSLDLINTSYNDTSRGYDFSSGGYATLNSPVIPETGDFTIETMIRTPLSLGTDGDMAIVSQVDDDKNDNGRFKLNYKYNSGHNTLIAFLNSTSKKTNLSFYFENSAYNDGLYLLQLVRAGSVFRLYVDGLLMSETNLSINDKISQSNFKIAKWNNASLQSFLGQIFSVRIYNRALTGDELLSNKVVDFNYYGNAADMEELKPYLVNNFVVSSGDGLYNIDNEYYFKGKSISNNFLKFKDTNELWKIVSINSDNTIKIINVDKTTNIPFDKSGYRNFETSSYCIKASIIADQETGDLYGCNAWEVQDGVLSSASINDYMNNNYYESLPSNIRNAVLTHDFYSGKIKDSVEMSSVIDECKSSIWNGKIGLLSVNDLFNSSTEESHVGDGTILFNNSWITDLSDQNTAVWTMTTSQKNSFDVWALANGTELTRRRASRYNQYVSAKSTLVFYMFPVIYIDSNVIVTGSGTSADPFIIM